MQIDPQQIDDALSRHGGRGALFISGGKDSMALLYLMRPWWGQLTVVWFDHGDAPDDTAELMRQVAQMVPHYVQLTGNAAEVINAHGVPSDICHPHAHGTFHDHILASDRGHIQSRYDCCQRTVWGPWAQWLHDAGITLWIRGQKKSDTTRAAATTGDGDGRNEVLFPLEHWSDADVFSFLEEQQIPYAKAHYQYGDSSIDCETCTAYLDHIDRVAYLSARAPHKLPEFRRRLDIAGTVLQPYVFAMRAQLMGGT